MKKILLLGGSAQQVIAIETAKKLGFYTILCDYLPDNPGQYSSDKFYQISTTDKESVLDVAKREQIDGILAYASDPAAPTAAYVAEIMGLPGNPYESVEILCNKDKFRHFLKENHFDTPVAHAYSKENAAVDQSSFHLPVIVKPADSSGSKGVTVLYSWDCIDKAINFALMFSRSHRFIVEEYIEKKHPYLIGGDIFVLNGKVTLWGLLNCHRDNHVNALVPTGKSYPLQLPSFDLERVKEILQSIVDKLRIKNCAMNVELLIDKENRVFPIDIGPRNGGNMIPDLLSYIFNVDIVEMSIKAAMGERIDNKAALINNACYATYNLHSSANGIYAGISFSEKIKKHIIKECLYVKPGDKIEYFDNASKALGILFFKFDSVKEMLHAMSHPDEWHSIEFLERKDEKEKWITVKLKGESL